MLAKASTRERILLVVALFLAVGMMYMLRSKLSAGDIRKATDLDKSITAAQEQMRSLAIPPVPPDQDPLRLDKKLQETKKQIEAEIQRLATLRRRFSREEADLIATRRPVSIRVASDDEEGDPTSGRYIPRLSRPSTQQTPLPPVPRLQLEQRLQDENLQIARLERQLAGDSAGSLQDLKVRISSLAKQNGVHVRENVPHALTTPQNMAETGEEVIRARPLVTKSLPTWLDPRTLYRIDQRPLQRLTIEANYAGLRGFLVGLDQLPRQIIVVQFEIDIMKKEDKPVPGMLTATLLLGL
ncbi:MAG: cell envelope integrity protein TolA [Gemmataceae bacterium]